MHILPDLFLTFAKVGVMTFGGGYAMLPILQREVVEKKGWATEDQLSDYFAVGQCTPGIIAVNVATFVGNSTAGIPGGILATLGVAFPSVVIITLLSSLILAFSANPYVINAFAGIRVCVCVLIFNAVLKLAKSAIRGGLGAKKEKEKRFGLAQICALCIFLAVAFVMLLLKPNPVLCVVAAALIGILYEFVLPRPQPSDEKKEG